MLPEDIENYLFNEFGDNFFNYHDMNSPDRQNSPTWYADQSLISYKLHEWLKR